MNLVAVIVLLGSAQRVNAQKPQEGPAFSKEAQERARKAAASKAVAPALLGCRGPITQVIDTAYEDVKFTSAVYGTSPGGGEGGQFDKAPVLTTKVTLANGVCLDAHLSAIVGSKQTYGFVSPMTFFQVTLTRLTPPIGAPRHMVGHYETPYGLTPASPAVALEAERDVDMYASNFFQRVGSRTVALVSCQGRRMKPTPGLSAGIDQRTSGASGVNSKGLMISTPHSTKCRTLRVATAKPFALAIDAICPSKMLIGRPICLRLPISAP